MPLHQGALDGLCGPYAITNSFELLGYDDVDAVFRTACRALAQRRWPEAIWEGTTLGDMQRMIKACRTNLPDANCISVSYPFMRSTPATHAAYWERFDEIFTDESVVCGIVGISKPSDHWIVVSREGNRLMFTDTDPHQPSVRKNKKSLYAGKHRQWPTQWQLESNELIVFSTT